jgi:hypothetical protein
VYFSEKNGFYFKDPIPGEVWEYAKTILPENTYPHTASTFEGLISKSTEVYEAYFKAIESRKEMLMIRLSVTSSLSRDQGQHGYGQHKATFKGKKFRTLEVHGGIGFVIEWDRIELVTNREQSYFKKTKQPDGTYVKSSHSWRVSNDMQSQWILIDHTDEREAFLESVNKNITALAERIAAFFLEDQTALESRIDNTPLKLNS